MISARPLHSIYLADEGEHAVRWLIGHIKYGQYTQIRDRLRSAPLSEVADWATRVNNYHLVQLIEATQNDTAPAVVMNQHLGPNDRLPAVSGSVLFAELNPGAVVNCVKVVGDTAIYEVADGDVVFDVQVAPAQSIAKVRGQEAITACWETEQGSSVVKEKLAELAAKVATNG